MNQNKSTLGATSDPPPSDLLRMKSAAAHLGFSVPTVYRAMAKRGLPARRLGGCWVFSRAELDAWVRNLPGINLPSAS